MLAPTPKRNPYVKFISAMFGDIEPRRQPPAATIQPIIVVARQPNFWHSVVAIGPSKNIIPYVIEPTHAVDKEIFWLVKPHCFYHNHNMIWGLIKFLCIS